MTDHVVALFSGAGGLSFGFARAGLKPAFAADIDRFACASYAANLGVDAHPLDLAGHGYDVAKRLLAPHRDCFAVIGGPPCQGFSSAGARRAGDPRNNLVFHYLEIVDILHPRWFFFENVEGILTANGGTSIRDLVACFTQRGYAVRVEKINFAAYGLPQSRKRVLIIGNRIGAWFALPMPTHSFSSGKHKSMTLLPRGPSLGDAIDDLPASARRDTLLCYPEGAISAYGTEMRRENQAGGVRHHVAAPTPAEVERLRLLKPGQTMKHLPEEYWHASFRRRAFRRVIDGTPSERRGGAPAGIKRLLVSESAPTVTGATCREFIHPTYDRPLTLREAARLQSFPDWFNFEGSPAAIATQIGNAVPPMAAGIFAAHLAAVDGAFGAGVARSVLPGLLGFRLTDAVGMSPALQHTEHLLRQLPSSAAKADEARMERLIGT